MKNLVLCAALMAGALLGGCGGDARPTAEGYVTVSPAVHLYYRAYGSGADTLVVLHGGPGLHHGYLVPALTRRLAGRTVIFYDQRGRGRSSRVDTLAVSVDSDVADLDAVRRRFRLDRMRVVGHHWGAAVAALYAIRHPEHVDRLLLISPFAVHPSFAYEFAMLGARGTDRGSAVRAFNAIHSPDAAASFCRDHPWWYFLPTPADSPSVASQVSGQVCDLAGDRLVEGEAVKRALLRDLGTWSWRVGLNGVRAPALVVEGQGPPIVEGAARRWAQHLADAQLLLVPGPYLYPWLGAPDAFDRAVDAFVRGQWPAGSVQPPPFLTTLSGAR